MGKDILVAIVTGLLGIISGALVAYVSAVLKFRKDLEAEYDKDLRNQRINVYKDLWRRLDLVARYDRPKPLNASTLQELTVSMRQWYFEIGGLYLSEESRKTYFDFKKTIEKLLKSSKYEAGELLNPQDTTIVLDQASLLRARLTKDVGTRKSSPIADRPDS
jgi:hypothetical protein